MVEKEKPQFRQKGGIARSEATPQLEGYEIDLADYVRVLLRGKWLVLCVLLVSTLVAVGISLLLPKTYQVGTTLELGQLGRAQTEPKISNLVAEPAQLVEKINGGAYDISVREALEIEEADFPKLEAENPKNTDLIEVAIKSTEPQQAKEILDKLNELILAEHKERVDAKTSLIEGNIVRLGTKITSLEGEQEVLEAKVAVFQAVPVYQQTIDIQNALLEAKGNLESKKQEIENRYLEISSLQSAIDDIVPTSVVKGPAIPLEPVGPRPLLNGAVAAMLGLFLGVLLTFGREWWAANFR